MSKTSTPPTATPTPDALAGAAADIHASALLIAGAVGKIRDDDPSNDRTAIRTIVTAVFDIGARASVILVGATYVWHQLIAPAFG